MTDALTTVYSLAADTEQVEAIQKATLTTEEFGIQQTHGLFGSPEWWQQISDGNLQLHTARGHITRVYMGSMGDWPAFKMATASGEELTWTRMATSKELSVLYREGAVVEVQYVIQLHKPKSWNGATETKCVVAVRIQG